MMIKINYPKRFKNDVKSIYPENKALHKLLDEGSEDVIYHLTDGFKSNTENICDANTVEVILYEHWLEIYKAQTRILNLN